MTNAFDHFMDSMLQRFREAGFEDGIDFSWEKGLVSVQGLIRGSNRTAKF